MDSGQAAEVGGGHSSKEPATPATRQVCFVAVCSRACSIQYAFFYTHTCPLLCCCPLSRTQGSAGLPAAPGQLLPPSSSKSTPQQRSSSKIPTPGTSSLSPSLRSSRKGGKGFPTDPLASTGSASALQKLRSQRDRDAGGSTPTSVAATISKAKEALAQARARAAAVGAGHHGGLASRVSSRVVEGAVSDKPFTLYGCVDLPAPKPAVTIHPPDAEEAAKRK